MRLKDAVSAGVAQLVERLFCKQMAGGSIPLAGLKQDANSGQVPKWPKGTDCKSVAPVLQRFESSPAH